MAGGVFIRRGCVAQDSATGIEELPLQRMHPFVYSEKGSPDTVFGCWLCIQFPFRYSKRRWLHRPCANARRWQKYLDNAVETGAYWS